jgi:hypothetical protein
MSGISIMLETSVQVQAGEPVGREGSEPKFLNNTVCENNG